MSKTLVQVGVQLVADVAIFAYHCHGVCVDDKLLQHAVALGNLAVGIGEIAYRNALASVLCTYPVGIRKVNAYCG